MTDLPIIMSAPMVRATLREVEKPGTGKTQTRRHAWGLKHAVAPDGDEGLLRVPSSWTRVKAGDRLWVRETWKPHSIYEGVKPSLIPESQVFYCADAKSFPSNTPWRTSIHMPRWASRLTLIVIGMMIERLQDISKADVIAEGITERDGQPITDVHAGWHEPYAALWNTLHGPGSWDANPEVVAITFRPVLANINSLELANALSPHERGG